MLTTLRTRLQPRDDRGAVAIFTAVAGIALLAAIGLVVDGGAKIQAVQKAHNAASEAARSGVQELNGQATYGTGITLDKAQATRAARNYLAAAGVDGHASITGGNELTVTTTSTSSTVFLGLIGIHTVSGDATETVRLVRQR